MSTTTIKKFATGSSPWVVAAWMALGLLSAAAVSLLVPPEVLAAVSGNGNGGGSSSGTQSAKNFNRKATGDLKQYGVPIFAVCAMASMATAVFSKKHGIGALGVVISAFGLAISVDPEGTLGGIGGGIADLFSA